MVPKGAGTRAVSGGETKAQSYSTKPVLKSSSRSSCHCGEETSLWHIQTQETAAKHWVTAHGSLLLAIIAGSSPRRCRLVTDGPGNQEEK